MRIIRGILGGCFAIALIVTLLISSFEIASYGDFGWYEAEYEKYDVLTDLEMEMKDAMHVTKEMMAYLRGNREDLVVDTIVNGEEREFFNDREKAHMADVRNLFVGGIRLRRISVVILIITVVTLIFIKADWKKLLAKSYLIGGILFALAVLILGLLISRDFYTYFELFHEILFTNDLWLLDWNTDLLIRMLPEGFFFDMALRIGAIFISLLLCFGAFSIVILRRKKKDKKNL